MLELQPLRFQAGWEVIHNFFTEYDPILHGEGDAIELCEDQLQLKNQKAALVIDLGWDPNYAIG